MKQQSLPRTTPEGKEFGERITEQAMVAEESFSAAANTDVVALRAFVLPS